MRSRIRSVLASSKYLSRMHALLSLARRNSYLTRMGWYQSYTKGLPVDGEALELPWFTYGAIEFIESRVTKTMRVFEFGSGNSTIWWSRRASRVISCEHDPEWYQRMKPLLADNVTTMHFDLGIGCDYSDSIKAYSNHFHVVVIDGRDRVNCARNAVPALLPEGVVVWDNSDRDQYRAGYAFLQSQGFRRLDFWGMGPINTYGWCTSIFYRPGNCFEI